MSTAFKTGMRNLMSGVALVTTSEAGSRYGLVATSVSSLCADPPSLLVCVNRSTSSHDPILRTGAFCVNLLGGEHEEISRQFSSPTLRDKRFTVGDWTLGEAALPYLNDALASFDCRVFQAVPVGTHTIFLAAVEEIRVANPLRSPLCYFNGNYMTVR